jgi:hypothetical protein
VKVLTFYDDDPEACHTFAIGTEQNISKISASFEKYKYKSFFELPDSGASGGMKGSPVWIRGKQGGLNSTWKAFLSSAMDRVVPLVKSGAVIGVFLGDEVICSGISVDNVTLVAEYIRSRIGDTALISLNECGGGRSFKPPFGIGALLPAAIDVISIDTYDLHNGTHEVLQAQEFYETTVFPRLRPHQSAFVVPGIVGASVGQKPPASGAPADDEQNLAKINGYYAWAKQDVRITGLHPWHWWTPGRNR